MQHSDPRDKVEFKIINYESKVQSLQMQHNNSVDDTELKLINYKNEVQSFQMQHCDPVDKVKFSHTAKICKQITPFMGFQFNY